MEIKETDLYSDYEAMSSDESYVVEKGEIDSTPTMQNALKPKKQKTVTEIIHDQLGPGYVPRGHKGGRQILVKEIEDNGPVVAGKEYDDPNIKEQWSDNRPRVSIEPDLTIH